MSPRRRIDPATPDAATTEAVAAPPASRFARWRMWVPSVRGRRWGLAAVTAAATVALASAVAVSTTVLVSHAQEQRADVRNAEVLDFVQSFMAFYLSPDPFQANAYVDRVQSQATGAFASYYAEVKNQVVLVVGMGAQTSGTVVNKAIEKWNDNGSVVALVVVRIARAAPDGKTATLLQERYAVTAVEEEQQWKISDVTSVF